MSPEPSSGTASLMPLSAHACRGAIAEEKTEEAKKRKLQDESHGAGEPVWKLKRDAHLARKALREGERLAKKVDRGKIQFDWLSHRQQELLEGFHARRLHVRVDLANLALWA